MSTLVAIAYPDRDTAEQVRQELIRATKEHILNLEDAVVVEHQLDGKIKLHQAMSTTGAIRRTPTSTLCRCGMLSAPYDAAAGSRAARRRASSSSLSDVWITWPP